MEEKKRSKPQREFEDIKRMLTQAEKALRSIEGSIEYIRGREEQASNSTKECRKISNALTQTVNSLKISATRLANACTIGDYNG